MENLNALLDGFAAVLTPIHLGWALIGVLAGTLAGVLPGIGSPFAVTLLLPFTGLRLESASALIAVAAFTVGLMYGNAIAAILLDAPSDPAAAVTSQEGYAMTHDGRAQSALTTAALGAFMGGVTAALLLALAAPAVGGVALRLGPVELAAAAGLALVIAATAFSRSLFRGLVSLALGCALGLVGVDMATGETRFTFGIPELMDGINHVVLMAGLFAVGEALFRISRRAHASSDTAVERAQLMSREDWRRSWGAWLRGAGFGCVLSILPVGGSVLPASASYAVERWLSRRGQQFGAGAIEGVAGPEAARAASNGALLIPVLALGVPVAMMNMGAVEPNAQPGGSPFPEGRDLIWLLAAGLATANVLMVAVNLPLIRLWLRLRAIPWPHLSGGIVVCAAVGVYMMNNALFDLIVLAVIGALGFAMRQLDLPLTPVVIGFVLGKFAEEQISRALLLSQGDWTVFVDRPIAAALLALAATALLAPSIGRLGRRRAASDAKPPNP